MDYKEVDMTDFSYALKAVLKGIAQDIAHGRYSEVDLFEFRSELMYHDEKDRLIIESMNSEGLPGVFGSADPSLFKSRIKGPASYLAYEEAGRPTVNFIVGPYSPGLFVDG